jgi:hypothetical protein
MHDIGLTLGWIALVLSAFENYLVVNKMWKRKHEKEVADSISIYGKFFGLIPAVMFSAYFISKSDPDLPAFLQRLIVLASILVFIWVGTRWFVKGEKTQGLLTLIRQALKMENKEVGDLAKSFFRPSGADAIIDILGQVAMIDKDLDKREKMFIKSFADAWNIELNWEEIKEKHNKVADDPFRELRKSMKNYLRSSPPRAQVEQMADVLLMLVKADERISSEEQLIMDELKGLIDDYLGREKANTFRVAVVPQDKEQEKAISTLLERELSKENIAGGRAYISEPFFSEQYAEIICERYRALNVFTVVVKPEQINMSKVIADSFNMRQ